ncbi:MAG: hypothetical protein OEO20_12500 [Gemmatimonadota bacterium]|nr:hypothetical protein [Gemmatimonadota bacterium]MDH3368534.1 hypothetical protein [Gemmatimonadota bacterium]MDH3479114.1 hypothetical protein [Gemmatimonadota bacterium]MDH3570210.1 hypothetical protein [Gemmatimonadota bacterium]MDH5551041.1 hypothetical protein [Gemmatimonadota bacterium]
MPGPVFGLVRRYARRLRYPRLLVLTAVLFGADLVFPDVVPFVDEILLGLLTVVFGSLRTRRAEARDPSGQGER